MIDYKVTDPNPAADQEAKARYQWLIERAVLVMNYKIKTLKVSPGSAKVINSGIASLGSDIRKVPSVPAAKAAIAKLNLKSSTLCLEDVFTCIREVVNAVGLNIFICVREPAVIPKLTTLCVNVVAAHKFSYGEAIQKLGSDFFSAFPQTEVDPERLVRNKLEAFVLGCTLLAIETKFLVKLLNAAREENPYNAMIIFLRANAADFTAYTKKNLVSLIKILLNKKHNGEIDEKALRDGLLECVEKYKPETAEAGYIHGLHCLLKVCDETIPLSERFYAMLEKMPKDHVFRPPLIKIIKERNALIAEHKAYNESMKLRSV